MKIFCVALHLWEVDCALQGRVWRERTFPHLLWDLQTVPLWQSVRATHPSCELDEVEQKTRGICITRLTFSLQLFMIWASNPSLATQSRVLLLNSTKIKGQRFPHRMPGMLSVSASAKINMQPAAKRLPVTSSSFEGHLAFK